MIGSIDILRVWVGGEGRGGEGRVGEDSQIRRNASNIYLPRLLHI